MNVLGPDVPDGPGDSGVLYVHDSVRDFVHDSGGRTLALSVCQPWFCQNDLGNDRGDVNDLERTLTPPLSSLSSPSGPLLVTAYPPHLQNRRYCLIRRVTLSWWNHLVRDHVKFFEQHPSLY